MRSKYCQAHYALKHSVTIIENSIKLSESKNYKNVFNYSNINFKFFLCNIKQENKTYLTFASAHLYSKFVEKQL